METNRIITDLLFQNGLYFLLPNHDKFDELNSNSLKGEFIPGDADLNDYNATGSYYTSTAVGTSNIINKPASLTSAFNMLVLSKGGNNIQVIFDYAGRIYLRGKITSGWQSWFEFDGINA